MERLRFGEQAGPNGKKVVTVNGWLAVFGVNNCHLEVAGPSGAPRAEVLMSAGEAAWLGNALIKWGDPEHSLEPTPEECADKGTQALRAVGFSTEPEDLDSSIYDLVANLLHLARKNDIEPDDIIRMARMHFDTEIQEAAEKLQPEPEPIITITTITQFYLCGGCDYYHKVGFVGDCREDAERYHYDDEGNLANPDGHGFRYGTFEIVDEDGNELRL